MLSIWEDDAAGLWAIDNRRALLHRSGTAWSTLALDGGLSAVWGRSSTDVWTAGTAEALWHWDGAAWIPVDAGHPGDFLALSGTGRDVWVGGSEALHGDGNGWSQLGLPLDGGRQITSIWADAFDDAWMIATGGNAEPSLLLHASGSAAAVAPLPANGPLSAVWGSGPTDLWVGGSNGFLAHSTGGAFVSARTGSVGDLEGAWGDPDDVWAVGASESGADGQVWRRLDGAWEVVETVPSRVLHAIAGTSSSDVWAAGNGGTLLHWDGASWTPSSSGTSNDLHAVWAATASDAWAAGGAGTLLHWNGGGWSPSPGGNVLWRALWGSRGDDVWAVGGSDGGVAWHWAGTSWTPVPAPGAGALSGIWGSSAEDVWACGGTQVWHWGGSAWSPLFVPTPVNPFSYPWSDRVWGTGPAEVWFSGPGGGNLVRWNGAALELTPIPAVPASVVGLWGGQGAGIWAVGSGGTVLHHP